MKLLNISTLGFSTLYTLNSNKGNLMHILNDGVITFKPLGFSERLNHIKGEISHCIWGLLCKTGNLLGLF